jgi:PAS domain S-box-containing protein
MGVVTLWYPDYWLDGFIKLATAVVSIGTAFAMWQAMPEALAIPSTAQLAATNGLLQHEVGERHRAEAALRDMNAELERRVAERTAELEAEVEQRRRAEETLRDSEERWRSMFEASAVGIALTDESQRFVATNEAFQKMLGYTAEELRSLGPVEITHEEDRPATLEMINRMLADRRAGYDVEKRYRRKDGAVIWVRVSTARPPDAGSSGLRGIPTIVVDITERKRAEDSMHEAREALLRVARLNTVGELSASIAHEINQPLGAIVANGQACLRLLAGSPPDVAEAREAVEEIIVDGKRASEVLKRVRAMVKNDMPECGPIDVNRTIGEVLTLTRQELQQHKVSVQSMMDPQLPFVLADRVQVQQVVLNLIVNGIEAMRETPDRPRVLTLRSQRSTDHEVAVSVEDTGGGVDPAHFGRIFEAFFTTKAEGMGMGLSICNSIIRAHGGRLSAAAGELGGAVFRFTLPAIEEVAA